MWSRWYAKQRRAFVPLRLLTSGSHEDGQPKFAQTLVPAQSWKYNVGLGGVAVALVSLYYANTTLEKSKTANDSTRISHEQGHKQDPEFSKEKVKEAFRRQFSMPVYALPQLERNDLHEKVLSYASKRILLIEGASGTGKTVVAQELLHDVSKSGKDGSRRGVLYYALDGPISNADQLFDEIVKSCGVHIGSSSSDYILNQACIESCKENNGNRPLLVIDNAQQLAAANDMLFGGIMGHLRGLMEDDSCDVILIDSDGTIFKKARRCSGLSFSARLRYLSWPHVPDQEMYKYIFENRDKIFQKAKVSEAQIAMFMKLFGSSFTELLAVKSEEDVDLYMETRLKNRRGVLRSMRNNQKEHFAVLKEVYSSSNHQAMIFYFGVLPGIAEELVKLNFLAHVDECRYKFHDRLTLEAMAAEMAAEMKTSEEKAAETKTTKRS